MKKVFMLTIFVCLLIISPLISADMIISQQPNKVYNVGDSITVPVTITTISGTSNQFSMDLFCGLRDINFYKNGVSLNAGEQKTMDASVVLTKGVIGEYTGMCKIKAMLPGDSVPYLLTDEFKISNLITIQPNTDQKEFEPEQSILIFGDAIKENGQGANGFIDLDIVVSNSSKDDIVQHGTIYNGMYSMNITFPKNMAAGNYLVKLNAYEVDTGGLKTNKGTIDYNLAIKQIPTSLELIFNNNTIEPGTDVKVNAILHDQTGEKINSNVIITIKRGETEIQVQSEKQTGEDLEFPIPYNEAPSNWTVFAISNQLTAQSTFIVIEKKDISVNIINGTVTFVNTGNVPYNDTVTIKIGNDSLNVPVFLDVDGTQQYKLKAPNGEYEVEVFNEKSESKLKQNVALTGRAIEVKDLSQQGFFARPLIWIFLGIIILCLIFIIARKMYKNKQYGMGSSGLFKKKVKQPTVSTANVAWENRAMPLSRDSKLETKNKANFSPSIKGNKQDISLVNINIKNLREVPSKKGITEEPLQKIINIAENKKAFVYENQDNLFFIISPSKTRTMQNEPIALDIAQNAKEILSDYNRIAKQKLNFGIAIEYGSIIEKTENGIMEFMSLGNLMTSAKRIASVAQGEVLLGEKIKDKLINVRTEKLENGKTIAYKIKDIKYHDEEHSRFIKSFLKRADDNNRGNVNNNTDTNKTDPNKDSKSLIKGFY